MEISKKNGSLFAAGMAAAIGLSSMYGPPRGTADDLSEAGSLRETSLAGSNKPVEDLLKLPMIYTPAFEPLPEKVRVEVEKFVREEFSKEGPTTPAQFVNGLASALSAGGLSEKQVQATLAASLSQGVMTFAEYKNAAEELVTLYPDNNYFASLAENLNNHPAGGVRITWVSSAGDPFGYDSLEVKREELNNSDWLPESASELPLGLYLSSFRLSRNEPGVSPGDSLQVSGTLRASSLGGDLIWEDSFGTSFAEHPSGHFREFEHLFNIVDSSNSEVILTLNYTVEQRSPELEPVSGGATFFGQTSALLKPVMHEQMHVGYEVVALDPDGTVLDVPGVATEFVSTAWYNTLFWQKESFQERALRELEADRAEGSLIGRELETISLVHSGKENDTLTLNLSSSDKTIVIYGATWCAPCAAISPVIDNFKVALAEANSPIKVLRISIDRDKEKYNEAVSGRYPDGVIAPEQFESFGIRGVPSFMIVEGGRISEAGILLRSQLQSWKEEVKQTD